MARIYAGVLGPLAMTTIIAAGLIHGRTRESIAFAAWVGLLAFAAVGWTLGWIANRTVEDSVRASIAKQLTEDGSGEVA